MITIINECTLCWICSLLSDVHVPASYGWLGTKRGKLISIDPSSYYCVSHYHSCLTELAGYAATDFQPMALD